MIWIIIGLMVVLFIAWVMLRGVKGPAYTLETVQKPINGLLKQGYNGGFLIIDISGSKYFFQLRKYIHAPGDYGIELCFPHAKWSINFFQEVVSLCNRDGLIYSIRTENADGSLEFLYVDFEKNVALAHKCLKNILLEVFGLNENVILFARLENATTENKLIDS